MNSVHHSAPGPDLIVIGSGVAGLAVVVEAAEAGLTVQVLEAADTVGGASAMSGAACFLVDTPLQRSRGIIDSVDLALADWERMGGPTADLEWARWYATDSAREVYQWCADLGIEWHALDQPEGNSVPRWHLPVGWGRRIVEVVEARARELGVTIRTGVTAEEVCLSQGQVTSVRTRSAAAEADQILLIDNEYYGTPEGPNPEAMKRFWVESPYVSAGDGPQALARAAGLPEEAVVHAISELNPAIRSGAATDPLTGRSLVGSHEVTSDLLAVQLFPMAQKNLGGVRTGPGCEVLTPSGDAVAGLYAAGEVAGMAGGHINGRAALEGTMFGPCVYSGRVAGRMVARRTQ